MKTLRIYLSWFRSLRSLRLSAVFALLLIIAAVGTTTPLISAEPTTDVVKAESVVTKDTTTKKTPPKTTKSPVKKPAQPTQQTSATTTRAATTQPPVAQPAPATNTVSIPSIGLSSPIVTVGLTPANAIDVHPSLVGWWNGSAKPGSTGAAFLDGHNPGVFSSLPRITVGAQIKVSMASGKQYSYKVVHREIVKLVNVDMDKALRVYGGASEGLNLMTCMGAYNPATGTTDERLIVYAVRS